MANKIFQYRKRIKGAEWKNCNEASYKGFQRGTNMQRMFEVREIEDDAAPTPNAVKKTRKRKKPTETEK